MVCGFCWLFGAFGFGGFPGGSFRHLRVCYQYNGKGHWCLNAYLKKHNNKTKGEEWSRRR